MKKFVITISLCIAACFAAKAQSYQLKGDYMYERNYYNPATRFYEEGMYIGSNASYTLNTPILSGKEPLDLSFDFLVARPNYSVFAAVSHDEHSYFCGTCISGGYNHIFRFNENHTLRIGGRAVLGINSIDFSHLPYEMPVEDKHSRIIPTPDIDLGLEYSYRFFHLGLAVKNVIGYEGKYQGVQYVSWPRSYMMHIRFDANLWQNKIMLNPFAVLGLYQNILFIAGTDLVFFKNYRISYSFRGPDLHHRMSASINICNRVILDGGYSLSTAHRYSMAHLGVKIRIGQ